MQTRYNIDDPLDSSAIHFGCGSMGTLLLGLLARPAYVHQLTGYTCGGLVYSGGRRGGMLLGLQLLGEWSSLSPGPVRGCGGQFAQRAMGKCVRSRGRGLDAENWQCAFRGWVGSLQYDGRVQTVGAVEGSGRLCLVHRGFGAACCWGAAAG